MSGNRVLLDARTLLPGDESDVEAAISAASLAGGSLRGT